MCSRHQGGAAPGRASHRVCGPAGPTRRGAAGRIRHRSQLRCRITRLQVPHPGLNPHVLIASGPWYTSIILWTSLGTIFGFGVFALAVLAAWGNRIASRRRLLNYAVSMQSLLPLAPEGDLEVMHRGRRLSRRRSSNSASSIRALATSRAQHSTLASRSSSISEYPLSPCSATAVTCSVPTASLQGEPTSR